MPSSNPAPRRLARVLHRVRKVVLLAIFLCILASSALLWLLSGEMGSRPTKKERAAYKKLPYYHDGVFSASESITFDADELREGSATLSRFFGSSRFAPKSPLPMKILNKRSFSNPPSQEFKLFWLGHASAIIELAGLRFGIDLVFDNAAPIPMMTPRYAESPLRREDLPPLDYVIITHNHYDHLEKRTVQSIKNAHFLVPMGLKRTLVNWGISSRRVTEQAWGESLNLGALRLTAETGLHHSNRCSLDRNSSSWNSYVFEFADCRVFWSGDTGYANHFKVLGEKYGSFDLAIMEIDGWSPSCPNAHLFPDQVITAAQDLKAKAILPVHWAVYDLAFHPWHKSVDMVLEFAQEADIPVFTPLMGEAFALGSMADVSAKPWWQFVDARVSQGGHASGGQGSWLGELGGIAELDLKNLPLLAPLFL